MTKQFWFGFSAAILLVLIVQWISPSDRYRLSPGRNGQTFEVDRRSGVVWIVSDDGTKTRVVAAKE